MADQLNPHFKENFWFCVYVFTAGFAYIAAITFMTVPKENQRIVDTATGFVLGSMIMSAIGYLLGGNPMQPKPKSPNDVNNTSAEQVNIDADKVDVKEK